jgi:hypothetical protein
MPGSLIEDLQRDAINRDLRVSDLLRKALLVSSKLNTHAMGRMHKRGQLGDRDFSHAELSYPGQSGRNMALR